MSDQVALLLEGELIQQGTPEAVYGRPVSRRAADYFGGCAYLASRVEDGTFTSPCLTCSVELPPGSTTCSSAPPPWTWPTPALWPCA